MVVIAQVHVEDMDREVVELVVEVSSIDGLHKLTEVLHSSLYPYP